jgi:hypothetical protein
MRRFTAECETATLLHHRNIVPAIGSGTLEDRRGNRIQYLVMEYVDGESLRDRMEREKLSRKDVAGTMSQLCDALTYAHRMGIVHRDIKPENVLLDAQGTVRLSDFGTALDVEAVERLTTDGEVPLTHLYAAPEIVLGEKDVDVRADVYSCGVLLCEMLTGISSRERSGSLKAWPRELLNWEKVIVKATAWRSTDRHESIADFRKAVRAANYADSLDAVLERFDMFVLLMVVGLEATTLLSAIFREQVVSRTFVAFLIWLPVVVMFFLFGRLAKKHKETEEVVAKRRRYWMTSVIPALTGAAVNAIVIICFQLRVPETDGTMGVLVLACMLVVLGAIGFLSSCLFHEGVTFWQLAQGFAFTVGVCAPLFTILFIAPGVLVAKLVLGITFDYQSKDHAGLLVSSAFFALCCSVASLRSGGLRNLQTN